MLKHTDLFEELPEKYYDSAFIDRLHAYLPGWEVDVIRGEMFTRSYGFIVDYLAEILRHLRQEDFSNRPDQHFNISEKISTRDRDAIYKTMSGLLKVLFPAGGESAEDVEELLQLAIESRKRVKDQLFRIDATFPEVDFFYTGLDGQKQRVQTVEEQEFPQFYHRKPSRDPKEQSADGQDIDGDVTENDAETQAYSSENVVAPPKLEEGHFTFAENRKGISFETLFGPYMDGASRIMVTDPYIRYFYQVRNMMEFVEMIVRRKPPEDQISIHLVTGPQDGDIQKQRDLLDSISEACTGSGVDFTWAFDTSGTAHARDIVTDNGWKIVLDRGLDIFQAPVRREGFSLGDRLQEHRMVKGFYVTYVRQ
jgi:ATP-dependent Lon protease